MVKKQNKKLNRSFNQKRNKQKSVQKINTSLLKTSMAKQPKARKTLRRSEKNTFEDR